jgi:hypothetical protein
MDKFVMDIKPKTEIGKKLLTITVPTDMVLSAVFSREPGVFLRIIRICWLYEAMSPCKYIFF